MEPHVVLRTLALRDFRNLARADLTFPPEGAVVIGDNGQGKSNLLEAIYYLHLLRSVRGARDVDVARFGAPGFHVAARTEGGRHHELSAGFEREGRRKRVRLDGAEPQRLSDALGALPCVLFSPADVELVAGDLMPRQAVDEHEPRTDRPASRRHVDVVLWGCPPPAQVGQPGPADQHRLVRGKPGQVENVTPLKPDAGLPL